MSFNKQNKSDYYKVKGIEIYHNSRDHRFSSGGLRKQVKYSETN